VPPNRGPRGFILKTTLAGGALALIGAAVWFSRPTSEIEYTTFAVRRGPLDINVVEGGNVEALESQEIKSRVKGWEGTKILFIVDEGYYVTEEDVAAKKKLVELDSSKLQEQLTNAEISFKGTQAALTEAEKALEIETNQAESDIYSANLEVTFAKMALSKYLGAEVTAVVMDALQELEEYERQRAAEAQAALEAREAAAKAMEEEMKRQALAATEAKTTEDNAPLEEEPKSPVPVIDLDDETADEPTDAETVGVTEGTEAPESSEEPDTLSLDDLRIPTPDINFSEYAREEILGSGEASQKLSTLEDALMMARAEQAKAQNDYDGKKRLFDKNFTTSNDLQNAKISLDKAISSVKAAEVARQLFVEYEFSKEAQKLMADYVLARRKLQRTEQQALSKLAQARAKLLSAEGQFAIESRRIRDYEEQIANCVMVAERAGLVVYGGNGRRYWDEEPIKEGTTVREKQAIITIPDMSKMAVKVNIHESDIKRIAVGQTARLRVDAFPDRPLKGEIVKVGVLPDSENRWMNPDLKVYETTIKIEGTFEWLKPGMSAEADILVKKLDDAVYIPIQSVVPQGDKQVCFVVDGGKVTPREIETDDLTVEFITVTQGLVAGERVLIRPPDGSRQEESEEDGENGESRPDAPSEAAPATAA
jgi:multidrug efflux pump subunit AcrA (membrane-fusion protein)